MSQINLKINEISKNTAQILPIEDLKKKLEKNKPLIVKLGMDPTSPDLHLGHAVVLRKLKQLQDMGHHVHFIIGDFTATIGDPSGKSKTRPVLTKETIEYNMQTYFNQVGRIIDTTRATVSYNSSWLGKLSGADLIELCKRVTVAHIIEREDFANRLDNHQSIGMHELLYPLLQGYDSISIRADIELGGTDQTFNLLMGRYLQEQYQLEPQVIITTPLLIGLDGTHKMSKSLGNAIGLNDKPEEAYGKLMSINDTLMWDYYKLLLETPHEELLTMQAQVINGTLHPMITKKQMAHGVVALFWSKKDAQKAQEHFENLFEKKDYNAAQELILLNTLTSPIWIVELLKKIGAVESSSQAKRLIETNSIEINGESINDFKKEINPIKDMVIRVGKHRFYKIH